MLSKKRKEKSSTYVYSKLPMASCCYFGWMSVISKKRSALFRPDERAIFLSNFAVISTPAEFELESRLHARPSYKQWNRGRRLQTNACSPRRSPLTEFSLSLFTSSATLSENSCFCDSVWILTSVWASERASNRPTDQPTDWQNVCVFCMCVGASEWLTTGFCTFLLLSCPRFYAGYLLKKEPTKEREKRESETRGSEILFPVKENGISLTHSLSGRQNSWYYYCPLLLSLPPPPSLGCWSNWVSDDFRGKRFFCIRWEKGFYAGARDVGKNICLSPEHCIALQVTWYQTASEKHEHCLIKRNLAHVRN